MIRISPMRYSIASVSLSLLFIVLLVSCQQVAEEGKSGQAVTGNVIFIHPDGSGAAMWMALRMIDQGPDGATEWDMLDHMGLYRGHQRYSASTTSHAGATVHAYGVKVGRDTFGSVPEKPVSTASGTGKSIMRDAVDAGISTGLVNSGHLCEPGTAVFLASAFHRKSTDSISLQLIESGVDVLLGGGEMLLLPYGVVGRHGQPGVRRDDRNLIEYAMELGYTVIYTREELLGLPDRTERVLGVFAAAHTFNDMTEEQLHTAGLSHYRPDAPTLAEMTNAALRILSRKDKPFFLVVEEEGTDNFANDNNAAGTIEAVRRADSAIGIARDFIEVHPNTLLITAADSDAGGMSIWPMPDDADPAVPLPLTTGSGAPLDGMRGSASAPFLSAVDRQGHRIPFGIAWAAEEDMLGPVIAKTHGANAELLPSNVDNTDIYRIMYLTLFGREIGRLE